MITRIQNSNVAFLVISCAGRDDGSTSIAPALRGRGADHGAEIATDTAPTVGGDATGVFRSAEQPELHPTPALADDFMCLMVAINYLQRAGAQLRDARRPRAPAGPIPLRISGSTTAWMPDLRDPVEPALAKARLYGDVQLLSRGGKCRIDYVLRSDWIRWAISNGSEYLVIRLLHQALRRGGIVRHRGSLAGDIGLRADINLADPSQNDLTDLAEEGACHD